MLHLASLRVKNIREFDPDRPGLDVVSPSSGINTFFGRHSRPRDF